VFGQGRDLRDLKIEKPKQPKQTAVKKQKSELMPFLWFWDQLDAQSQTEFEKQVLAQAEPSKRRRYDDARTGGRYTADYFRLAILNDHLFGKTAVRHPKVLRDWRAARDGVAGPSMVLAAVIAKRSTSTRNACLTLPTVSSRLDRVSISRWLKRPMS
jgi:hypothetical protein